MKTWFFHHSIQGLSQSEKYLILVTSFLRPQHLPPVQILRSTFDSHFSSVCPTLVFHLSYHQTFVGFCVYICLDTFVWDFNVIFMCQWRFSYGMFPQRATQVCALYMLIQQSHSKWHPPCSFLVSFHILVSFTAPI